MATEKYTKMSDDDGMKNAGMCEYESLYKAYSKDEHVYANISLDTDELWREAKIVAYKASHSNKVEEIRKLYVSYHDRYVDLFTNKTDEEQIESSNRIRKDVFTYAWIMLYHMEMSNPDEETIRLLTRNEIVSDERPLCEGMFTITSVRQAIGWVLEHYIDAFDLNYLIPQYEYLKKKYNIKYDYNYVTGKWINKKAEKEMKEYLANYRPNEPISSEDTLKVKHNNDVAEELKSIFYNNQNAVNDFLRKIKGAAPMDVTREVNILISERIVSNISCGKPLWEILNKHGYYDRGLNNWYDQINKKQKKITAKK